MRARQRNGLVSGIGLGLLLFGLVIGATGCASRYKVTLTNGNVYTARGKPKLDKQTGAYLFKDTKGQAMSVPGFRVKEIAPVGMEDKVEFGPTPSQQQKPAFPRSGKF